MHWRYRCAYVALTRLYTVEAENYIDDSGVQVADVVIGLLLLQKGQLQLPGGNEQLPHESFDYFCSRVYVAVVKAYDTQPELKDLRRTVLHAIEQGEEPASGPDYPTLASDLCAPDRAGTPQNNGASQHFL